MHDTNKPLRFSDATTYGAAFYQEETQEGASSQYILFHIDHDHYGIDIRHVHRILTKRAISPLPYVPHHIQGVINLRGEIISVTSLNHFLGINASPPQEQDHRKILVLKDKTLVTGLVVGQTLRIATIAESLHEKNTATQPQWNTLISSHVYWEKLHITILNAPALLQETRLQNHSVKTS